MVNTAPTVLYMIIRVVVACVCGGAIGFERTKRLKEAGIRTHCIIAAGAALLMVVSKYGFTDMINAAGDLYPGTKGTDPARIVAQVVSGISFLGAGVIFKNGNSVKGLTTAAGIWATAAVGLTIGSGMYIPGFVGTLIIVVVQILFHRYSIGNDAYSENDVQVTIEDSGNFRDEFMKLVKEKHIQVITMRIDRKTEEVTLYTIVLRTRHDFGAQEAIDLFMNFPGVRSISF